MSLFMYRSVLTYIVLYPVGQLPMMSQFCVTDTTRYRHVLSFDPCMVVFQAGENMLQAMVRDHPACYN